MKSIVLRLRVTRTLIALLALAFVFILIIILAHSGAIHSGAMLVHNELAFVPNEYQYRCC